MTISPLLSQAEATSRISRPLLKKEGKGIGGQGFLGVVGTVEEKLHTTGDGAELADDQFVVVERVVVPYRILFKLPWVVYEIVVHCKVTHPNVGICNDLASGRPSPGLLCGGSVSLGA